MALEPKETRLPFIYNVKFDRFDYINARHNACTLQSEIGQASYVKAVKEARDHLLSLQRQTYPLVAYSYEIRNPPIKALLEILFLSLILKKAFSDMQTFPRFKTDSNADFVAGLIFCVLISIYAFNIVKKNVNLISTKLFKIEPRLSLEEALTDSTSGFFEHYAGGFFGRDRNARTDLVGNSVPLISHNIERLDGPQLLELYQQIFPGDLLQPEQREVPGLD